MIAVADKIGWICIDVVRNEDWSIGRTQRQSQIS